jgi:hypothetical protein
MKLITLCAFGALAGCAYDTGTEGYTDNSYSYDNSQEIINRIDQMEFDVKQQQVFHDMEEQRRDFFWF